MLRTLPDVSGRSSVVECHLAKVNVESSNLFARSIPLPLLEYVMGFFRFRKGVRIAPGIRLNITKHGINSLTLGGKGISYNIGKKGTRATGGLPGTGLSYSEYTSYQQKEQQTEINRETGEITEHSVVRSVSWLQILCIALIVIGIFAIRS
jgi:hypothetical protein